MKYNDDILHIIYSYASDHRQKYQLVMAQLSHKFKMIDVLMELTIYVILKELNIEVVIEYIHEFNL